MNCKFAEEEGRVSELHQRHVAQWLSENSAMIRDSDYMEGSRFLINGRYWHFEEYTDKGGFIFKSRYRKYDYRAEYIPHDYGQYGQMKFQRKLRNSYKQKLNVMLNAEEARSITNRQNDLTEKVEEKIHRQSKAGMSTAVVMGVGEYSNDTVSKVVEALKENGYEVRTTKAQIFIRW